MDLIDNIKVASFNCKNIKSSTQEINELCKNNDIVLLQETWLRDFEVAYVTRINKYFYGVSVSAVDTSKEVVKGRPFGGLAVLWKKTLGEKINIVKYDDSRILGIEVKNNNTKILFLNVYLPYDKGDNLEDFLYYLYKINDIIENYDTPYVYALGDFNADTSGIFHDDIKHRFGNELTKFCIQESLTISDTLLCNMNNTYTFYSEAHKTTSWLDHIVTTPMAHELLQNAYVDVKYVSSDHFPLICNVKYVMNETPVEDNVNNEDFIKIVWEKVSQESLYMYKELTSLKLHNIKVCDNLLKCDDSQCSIISHKHEIDNLYNNIVQAINESSTVLHSKPHTVNNIIPGWNDICKEAHAEAREAFLLWCSHGKQKQGAVFELMCKTRAAFKSVLRKCKRDKDIHIADKLASKFLYKDSKEFWKSVKNINKSDVPPLPATINGISGKNNIVNFWKEHYSNLLNLNSKRTCITSTENCNNEPLVQFTSDEILLIIKNLKNGKSPGFDGLYSENFKHADTIIADLLALLYNSCIIHGYIPDKLMDTIINPVIKDKKGDVNNKDNYRPIAVTSVMSKIFELLLLNYCKDQLYTSDNQYGFKANHSTDMAVFAFKQIVEYYMSLNSPVYICFLDASKAFDRINHVIMFEKLKKRNINFYIIRLLRYWYHHQFFYVKWDNIFSEGFKTTNGVRQGGILSPIFFNVYMDGLSTLLNSSNTGCNMNGVIYNHIMYADDTLLIAPSPNSIQKMLGLCQHYANNNDILFNEKKTVLMCVKPKCHKNIFIPVILLNEKEITIVHKHKYLGIIITDDFMDNMDIGRITKSIYASGNILISRFFKCTDNVKVTLFKTFCCNFYGNHLWCNFYKQSLEKARKAFNKIFCKFFNIKRIDVTKTLLYFNINPFIVILRKSSYGFKNRLSNSENILIKTVHNSLFFLTSSLYKRWLLTMYS